MKIAYRIANASYINTEQEFYALAYRWGREVLNKKDYKEITFLDGSQLLMTKLSEIIARG